MNDTKQNLLNHSAEYHKLLSEFEDSPERRAIWDKVKELDALIWHHGQHLKVTTPATSAPAADTSPIPVDGQVAPDTQAPSPSDGNTEPADPANQNVTTTGDTATSAASDSTPEQTGTTRQPTSSLVGDDMTGASVSSTPAVDSSVPRDSTGQPVPQP